VPTMARWILALAAEANRVKPSAAQAVPSRLQLSVSISAAEFTKRQFFETQAFGFA